jgi:hypothetical protein
MNLNEAIIGENSWRGDKQRTVEGYDVASLEGSKNGQSRLRASEERSPP